MIDKFKVSDALMGFSAGVAGNGAQFQAQQVALSKERKEALSLDMLETRKLLDVSPLKAAEFLTERKSHIGRLRGDPKETDQLISMIEGGDIDGARRELDEGIEMAQMRGYLPKPKGPQVIDPSMVDPSGNLNERLADGSLRQTKIFDRVSGNQKEVRKELRARIGSANKDISTRATQVKDNYNKIIGLSKEVDKGNRNATAQALIALVKLGEPSSTVREGEMIAAINSPNPIAVMTKLLNDEGVSEDLSKSIMASIDPLAPSVINTEDLLATAEQLVTSQVPTIQDDFRIQREFATDNLGDAGIKSLFTASLIDKIDGIGKLIAPKPGSAPLIKKKFRFDGQGNPISD